MSGQFGYQKNIMEDKNSFYTAEGFGHCCEHM